MPSFRELLKSTKSEITEVSTEEAETLLEGDWTLLAVREPDEYEQGAIQGSVHIPRGNLESSIEARVPYKEIKIVVIYDPSDNDLTMEMWTNSNGLKIIDLQ